MSKKICLSLPVKNLEAATKFYEALGFTKNALYSNDDASGMPWSEDILFMLITHEFYSKFTSKTIPDLNSTSRALIALSLNSREDVQKFVDTDKVIGSSYFESEPNKGLDFMFGLEVTDLDGHILEPFFMDVSKFPTN